MWFPLVTVAAALLTLVSPSTDKCFDLTLSEKCASTNYETYVECVRNRAKRSANSNCIDTCNSCDCESCSYSGCGSSCSSCCGTCCADYMPCSTNHCCHKTCHAQCSTSRCRSNCRKSCFDTIGRNVTAHADAAVGGSSGFPQGRIDTVNRHNITTIIHLNNVINNTNIVDIPITFNNTNEQNITLHVPQEKPEGNSTGEKCCTVIGPRQCVSHPKPRCFHYRTRQCGPYCTTSIVHKEQRQICESIYPQPQQNCRQQIVYIPQPRPRCFYQSNWPYVACGIQPPASCEGCYSHYADSRSTDYLDCPSQCYDEGFGGGANMYRQGPVYRPYYSHAPPCYHSMPCYRGMYDVMPQQFLPQQGEQMMDVPVEDPQFFPQQFLFPQGEQIVDVPVDDPSNSSTAAFEPLFRAGDVGPVYRGDRDVEIEMNYKERPKAFSEVKIKNDKDMNKTTTALHAGAARKG